MASNRINLLHCALDMGIGGLQRLITETSLAMDRDRFNIEVLCYDRLGCFADRLQENDIPVTLLQKNQNHFDAWYPWRLSRFLRRKKIHVLQIHTGAFFFGALAGRLAGTPAVVYTEHGRFLVEPTVRLIEDRIAATFTGRIIAVSNELETYLAERVKLPARKITTVINGIATDAFAPRPKPTRLLEEFSLSESTRVVGTVGRLDGVKDQLSMIRAFELLHNRIEDSRLILVGDGPLRNELAAYVRDNHLESLVLMPGERNDIPDLLNLFDIFVLSSLSEGTSVSLLEAMASGVAPVVTNVGGNPSIVAHQSDGLIVEPKDVNLLADAMVEVLSDYDKRATFGRKAVEKVVREYSLTAMNENYVDIYMQLLARKKRFRSLTGQK